MDSRGTVEDKAQGGRGRESGNLWRVARVASSALAALIVPPVCLACRTRLASHNALCPDCWRLISFIQPPYCNRLGLPMPFDTGGEMLSAAAAADPPDYHRARAVASFDGVMRDLIHALKFEDRHDMRQLFGGWLVSTGAPLLADPDVVLVPVPLSRLGLIRRRFNQAAILAREVARQSGRTYRPQVLIRQKRTRSQVGLTRDQRRLNVAGAFAVPARQRSHIAGRPVLLIDDVITTGATAGACARALLTAGASRVDVLTLAMVTDRPQVTV